MQPHQPQQPQQQQLQMQQMQQLQQLQQLQQIQHFVPIQGESVIGPSGGVVVRPNTNLRTNAVLGISIPAARNSMAKTPVNVNAAPITEVISTVETVETKINDDAVPNPLIGMVQDVIFAMILNVPALRTKLKVILDNPSLIGAEISKVYDELKTKLTPQELEQLNSYACQDSSRRTIGSVMQTAFSNIMADGKIDMSDAPHFLALIHDCIMLFSADATSNNAVALNSNTVITFLHFVLKCILILTLDGPEEDAALVMLDGSFKLVKLTVLPLIASKKWCACFA
jgi:hypothetical protein